jgi:hypothetical protein
MQLSDQYKVIYQRNISGIALVVKENDQYRWFEYGGSAIQSLMSKQRPDQIIMPVFQSLILFLLLDNNIFKKNSLKVLNLGLGGASIERALCTIPEIEITSVDASLNIIEMAKRYFKLPKQVKVACQKAEMFIQQTNDFYDVVLCDLFVDGQSAECIFNQEFYFNLSKITFDNASLMINLQAENEAQLLHVLLSIKKCFSYIALIEFDDYKNIVILASAQEIPNQAKLLSRLKNIKSDFPCFQNLELQQVITKMRYIPPRIE